MAERGGTNWISGRMAIALVVVSAFALVAFMALSAYRHEPDSQRIGSEANPNDDCNNPCNGAVTSRVSFRKKRGAPGKIRTRDPQIRSLVLYPAELPVQL